MKEPVAASVPGATCDPFWRGGLTVWQPARGGGYRFNLDAVLLAGFAGPGAHIIDLGAGCGIVGLLLLKSGLAQRVTAVEIQPELAALAERNVAANALAGRMQVVCGDLRQFTGELADGVVFNPPYFAAGQGPASPQRGRDLARHERSATLADFVVCAARHLRPGGRLAAIVRAQRGAELAQQLRHQVGAVTRRREVVARQGQPARHVLLEGQRGAVDGGAALELMEPLVVHAGLGGAFSAEVRRLLRET